MNAFGKIGDADVAALLGYLRSNPPALAPGGEAQPPTQLTLTGERTDVEIAAEGGG